jgi:hypothetical protein
MPSGTGIVFRVKEKLSRIRPANPGQAGRTSSIRSADLAVLLICLNSSFSEDGSATRINNQRATTDQETYSPRKEIDSPSPWT